MSVNTSSKLRNVVVVLGLMVAAGVLHLQGTAEAHVYTSPGPYWCSPHNQSSSNKGSNDYDCYHDGTTYHRTFYCAAGSLCSNALCSGKSVCGYSYSDGTTTHGGAGGHKATVPSTPHCGWTLSTCLNKM